MNELVLYYSYSGNTKKIALDMAEKLNMQSCEVIDEVKPGKFKAYTKGCYRAMKGIPSPIKSFSLDLAECETVFVFAPIWAGAIAPPMNAALAKIPVNTKISLRLVSGSGRSNKVKIVERIEALGLEILDYEDIKG